MFLENDFARPLFDFDKGGKAKAFECLMPVMTEWLKPKSRKPCGRITRTEQGMRMHLKSVHGWKEQPCLYSTELQNESQNGKPRGLRMFTKENIAATTKRSSMTATEPEADHQPALLQLAEPEMKGEKSQKPTREKK